MAGRAHAAAYRTAPTLYQPTLPELRFVAIGDVSPDLGSVAARRFGYERSDTSWQAIAEDPDINVVSVAVANFLHREIVDGLVAAGKHVLCEKPLSDNLEDAAAVLLDAAREAGIPISNQLIRQADLLDRLELARTNNSEQSSTAITTPRLPGSTSRVRGASGQYFTGTVCAFSRPQVRSIRSTRASRVMAPSMSWPMLTTTSGVRVRAISAAISNTVPSGPTNASSRVCWGRHCSTVRSARSWRKSSACSSSTTRASVGSSMQYRGIAIRSTCVPGRMVIGRLCRSTTMRPGRSLPASSFRASSAEVSNPTVGNGTARSRARRMSSEEPNFDWGG